MVPAPPASLNTFDTRRPWTSGGISFELFSLDRLAERFPRVSGLPRSLKVLLENLLRCEDGRAVNSQQIERLAQWEPGTGTPTELAFSPARVLLQDFTGVPCIADLAAMREALSALGAPPERVNPLVPADLVIDHSVQVDAFGSASAFATNVRLELERNRERYAFLKWGQQALRDFRVVPPGTGICHQVNLESLAQVVFGRAGGLLYPDTLVGTDSHTTMVNALGVVGWGVGGIEAEAAMLGQPISLLIPEVVGVRLRGSLPAGTTATDAVLTVTELLRKHHVVGKFVEFFGPGMASLTLPDRATLANMAPEYGATIGFFPVDDRTLDYLRLTARSDEHVARVEAYCRAQGLFDVPGAPEPRFSEVIELDLAGIEPSLAGPRRPQDRVPLRRVKTVHREAVRELVGPGAAAAAPLAEPGPGASALGHGSVVIAAITSCTNTSNPSVMLGAGLLAKKAVERGLSSRPWVKTSLAPGSRVVLDYLHEAGLLGPLEALGFQLVGLGCTTCIGNSGPLPKAVAEAVEQQGLAVAAVLSGNRNFEGRIHPQVRLNYLASPPLVVAYALAGRMDFDPLTEPLALDPKGQPVFLGELWPSPEELQALLATATKPEHYRRRYAALTRGDAQWEALEAPAEHTFRWEAGSTYVRRPPFLEGLQRVPEKLQKLEGARVLAWLGDSVTTDHISPAGNIAPASPAADYLRSQGVAPQDFNSYGARRGNHEVMVRGTFANIRLKNLLVPGVEGGVTLHLPSGQRMSIYDAAVRYQSEKVPLVILAGAEYGTGSSRDWAAKGTRLLGVRAVLAKSFERIHRSNLVGMGVLPLQFDEGEDAQSLQLCGTERISVVGLAEGLAPSSRLEVRAELDDGQTKRFFATARIDTPNELEYFRHGGILPFVVRQLARDAAPGRG